MAVKCKVCMEVGFLARSSVFSLSIFLQNQRQYVHRERKCTLRQMSPPKKDNTTEWQLWNLHTQKVGTIRTQDTTVSRSKDKQFKVYHIYLGTPLHLHTSSYIQVQNNSATSVNLCDYFMHKKDRRNKHFTGLTLACA